MLPISARRALFDSPIIGERAQLSPCSTKRRKSGPSPRIGPARRAAGQSNTTAYRGARSSWRGSLTVVVHPCDESDCAVPGRRGRAGIISPILVGTAEEDHGGAQQLRSRHKRFRDRRCGRIAKRGAERRSES